MRKQIVRQTPGIPFRELTRIRVLNPVNQAAGRTERADSPSHPDAGSRRRLKTPAG
jgi:hypothetical protein